MATKKEETTVDNPPVIKIVKGLTDYLLIRSQAEDAMRENDKIEIRDAAIKDGFCNYTYEIMEGTHEGFKHSVKGKGIVRDSMNEAFVKLNVHLAAIDDIFKHAKKKVSDIDLFHDAELTLLYETTGFKVTGGEENINLVLLGNKRLSIGSRMELDTPRFTLDQYGGYKWYNELTTALEACRNEVTLYHFGNYIVPEKEEEAEHPKQSKIDFAAADGQTTNGSGSNSDSGFEQNKV